MVTDKTAYISTSNWYGDYFVDTAGAAFVYNSNNNNNFFNNNNNVLNNNNNVLNNNNNFSNNNTIDNNTNFVDIRTQLVEVFERDWNSPYAVPLRKL